MLKITGIKKAVGYYKWAYRASWYWDLMLDRLTGEVWTDAFPSLNEWNVYHDEAIINLGRIMIENGLDITMVTVKQAAEEVCKEYGRVKKNDVLFEVDDSDVLTKMETYCSGENITIPSTLPNGRVIREIAEGFCCGKFNKITISDGIAVKAGAFRDADVNEVFWNDYPIIPSHCFEESSLKKIHNIGHVCEIGKRAFFHCELSRITWPKGCTRIPNECFECCYHLKEIYGINNVTHIGKRAFKECDDLCKIKWPANCLDIPYACFFDCRKLTYFNMPKNAKTVGRFAFKGSGVKEIVWPDECGVIPYRCFCDSALEKLTNIAHVSRIDSEAFSHACSLNHLDLTKCPISHIGQRAFEKVDMNSVSAPYYMDEAEFSRLF